jgi:hypothetical protein
MEIGSQNHVSAALFPGKRTAARCAEIVGAPETVRRGAENLLPTGIRSPDPSAGSESLYRLLHKSSLKTYSI